jgi:hypothetical protein
MYWFGSELHLDSFDLAGFLAAPVGIFPPDMTVIPRWTLWTQFAEDLVRPLGPGARMSTRCWSTGCRPPRPDGRLPKLPRGTRRTTILTGTSGVRIAEVGPDE